MNGCVICSHPKRAEIEQACLLRNFGDTNVDLHDIAKEFDVDLKALQVHVLMHMPLVDESALAVDNHESIAAGIKRKEADILRQVMEENYVLLKNLSSKINTIISQHTTESPTLCQVTKAVSDLYLGTNMAIRETANTLIKMDFAVNGSKDEGTSSLLNLVKAIRGDGDTSNKDGD